MKYLKILLFIILPALLRAQNLIPLYENNLVPNVKGKGEIPTLTLYKPAPDKFNGTAVIVCSGGSYFGRANSVEGTPAAQRLVQDGFTVFLLDYRVPKAEQMIHKETGPLMDAERAVQYVREHAAEYHIKPDRIGIMGFSAGGHLVSTLATHFNKVLIDNPKQTSLRPDFVILIYPVISFADSLTHWDSRNNLIGPDLSPERIKEYSNELQVTDATPPCFIVHAIDDSGVKVANSLYFEAALRQHKVPVEIFLYAAGGHGFGIKNKTAQVQWIDRCIPWIMKFK